MKGKGTRVSTPDQSDPGQESPHEPRLPDFSAGSAGTGSGRSDGSGASGASGWGNDPSGALNAQLHDSSEENSSRKVVIGIVIGGIALIAALGFFVSQVAMRSIEKEPIAKEGSTVGVNTQGDPNNKEEQPTPAAPNEPPPEIFTQAPTTQCLMSTKPTVSRTQSGNTVKGGGLEYTVPENWDSEWYQNENVPYLYDTGAYSKQVESCWYSVVTVGRIEWQEDVEGPYPGTEQMAVAMFQCYATHFNVVEQFGDNPKITNYTSKSTTVDGRPAWIVQATYGFDPKSKGIRLRTTNASIVTAIVVETPKGPSALVSDVAADHPEHVKGLEEAIATLKVTE